MSARRVLLLAAALLLALSAVWGWSPRTVPAGVAAAACGSAFAPDRLGQVAGQYGAELSAVGVRRGPVVDVAAACDGALSQARTVALLLLVVGAGCGLAAATRGGRERDSSAT